MQVISAGYDRTADIDGELNQSIQVGKIHINAFDPKIQSSELKTLELDTLNTERIIRISALWTLFTKADLFLSGFGPMITLSLNGAQNFKIFSAYY